MIQISSPGGYDKLEYKPLSDTKYTIGANVKLDSISEEDLVTVQTCAAGVNYADVESRGKQEKTSCNKCMTIIRLPGCCPGPPGDQERGVRL